MCISAACCERQSAFSQTQTLSHHRLILKGRTQSSPTGYLERSEIAATRLFRDHDDWAGATDNAESPKRSISTAKNRTERSSNMSTQSDQRSLSVKPGEQQAQ